MEQQDSKFEQDLTQTLHHQHVVVPEQALERLLVAIDSDAVTDAATHRYSYQKGLSTFIHNYAVRMQNAWKIGVPIGVVAVVALAVVMNTNSPTPGDDTGRQVAAVNSNSDSTQGAVDQADSKKIVVPTSGASTAASIAVASDIDTWMAEFEAENQTVLASFSDTDMLEYDSAEANSFDSAYNDQEI